MLIYKVSWFLLISLGGIRTHNYNHCENCQMQKCFPDGQEVYIRDKNGNFVRWGNKPEEDQEGNGNYRPSHKPHGHGSNNGDNSHYPKKDPGSHTHDGGNSGDWVITPPDGSTPIHIDPRKYDHLPKGDVIWAINAGGPAIQGAGGIYYKEDESGSLKWSWLGDNLIGQAIKDDYDLYRTVAWGDSLKYEVPVVKDGCYVLVLKFVEGDKYAPNQRVFNVQLNNQFILLKNFDVFEKAGGRGIAYDVAFEFMLDDGYLIFDRQRALYPGKLSIDFRKQYGWFADVAAFYVMTGKKQDIPDCECMHDGVSLERVNKKNMN